MGFTESGVNDGTPFALVGYHGGTSPTTAAINLIGYKWDGGTNRAALANSELILQISNTIGTPKVTILGSGNTGINDTAPAEALDVTGNINTTGVVKVDDVQVLSNRVIDARAADVANSGDATTDGLIDALRDAMIAHGLIAASA